MSKVNKITLQRNIATKTQPTSSDIGSLVNQANNRTLDYEMRVWNLRISRPQNISFFSFHLVCPDDKLDPLLRFIKQSMDFQGEYISFEIQKPIYFLSKVIAELKEKILASKSDRVLIIVKGFEKVFEHYLKMAEGKVLSSQDIAHCYDQSVKDRSEGNFREIASLSETLTKLRKKVIVITHAGGSPGENTYNARLSSVSRFQDGLIII